MDFAVFITVIVCRVLRLLTMQIVIYVYMAARGIIFLEHVHRAANSQMLILVIVLQL